MDLIIKQVLSKIESNGFEAYIVGGYVRDLYLGISTTDIDIATNALPKDLIKIFSKGVVSKDAYGSFRLLKGKFLFDIMTYRKESDYINRRPTKVTYVNNLLTDLERRDFTINSMCMNVRGEIIDLLGGINDIDNRRIKVIGNTKMKLKEDPLRILRAIRFSVILDFKIDNEIVKYTKKYHKLIKQLSYDRKKEEMEKILVSPNVIKGLEYMKDLKVLDALEIKYTKVVSVDDLCGMWSQLIFSPNYNFTKQEKENISTIQKILKYGKIDNNTLYNHGLYLNIVAGKIINEHLSDITKKHVALPIHSLKDIDITTAEIISILNIEPCAIINKIYKELESKIINNELKNEKSVIINYIMGKKW